MRPRDLQRLASETFDVAIVGGGIHGAAAAWEAASRGLSAALVEKGDFGSATSANSLKIIHGGLRYLQAADFRRMRESIRERRALLSIAPHLVRPLRFVIPAGSGMRGRAALRLALAATDAIGFDRNPPGDPGGRLPAGRILSPEELLRDAPGLGPEGAKAGGAEFWDCQVHDSERLVIEFVRAASFAGAAVANYAEAGAVLVEGGRVAGLSVRDALSGESFDLRARTVINAAGPWGSRIVGLARRALTGGSRSLPGESSGPAALPLFCRGWNLVLPAAGTTDAAIGIASGAGGADATVRDNRPGRFIFLTPWRGRMILGTAYSRWSASPDDLRLDGRDVSGFLGELEAAAPSLRIAPSQVAFAHAGILPAVPAGGGAVALASRSVVMDHAPEGVPGLVTLHSVKYTTARLLAEKAVNIVAHRLGRAVRRSETARTPLPGGRGGPLPRLAADAASEASRLGVTLTPAVTERLARSHGSLFPEVLSIVREREDLGRPLCDGVDHLGGEVLHAVRHEWAVKLSDVLMRRTGLGSAGNPGRAAVEAAARLMAAELGWDASQIAREVAETETAWPSW